MRYKAGMLRIRLAEPEDAALVFDFVCALARYEREPDAVKVDAATLARHLAETPPPFECLLAELDRVPAGFALFFHSYSTWRGQRGLWLEDLFVLERFRRRGVGRALLRRAAAIAVERQCGRFEWSVLDWNQTAIAFYEQLGAEVIERWRICRVSDSALQRLASEE